MKPSKRKQILASYLHHSHRFDAAARERSRTRGESAPSIEPVRGLEHDPTGREVEVLQLISDGLVNREIGQRLFLSHRTVGGHLYRTFPKLGITSRGQLRREALDTTS